MALRLPSMTREYLKVPVVATEGGRLVDLTAASVDIAVTAGDAEPVDADWKGAAWEGVSPNLSARLLIGPGSTFGALANGSYSVWVRVNRSPEAVVRHAGKLTIT